MYYPALQEYLCSELPRGRHDERDGALGVVQRALVLDVPEHGQQEGERLAAPGLGYADDVSAAHDGRDRLVLDREGVDVPLLVDQVRELLVRQAALVPVLHRLRTVLAPHLHVAQQFPQQTHFFDRHGRLVRGLLNLRRVSNFCEPL